MPRAGARPRCSCLCPPRSRWPRHPGRIERAKWWRVDLRANYGRAVSRRIVIAVYLPNRDRCFAGGRERGAPAGAEDVTGAVSKPVAGAGPAAGQPHEVLTSFRASRGTPSGVTRVSGLKPLRGSVRAPGGLFADRTRHRRHSFSEVSSLHSRYPGERRSSSRPPERPRER
jgi:hypothetical protein